MLAVALAPKSSGGLLSPSTMDHVSWWMLAVALALGLWWMLAVALALSPLVDIGSSTSTRSLVDVGSSTSTKSSGGCWQ